MRFVYLFVFILLVTGLSLFIRGNPAHRPKIWFALGFSAWLITPYHLLFNLWPGWNMWPGYVKGLELTIVDVFAFAILASGIHKRDPMRFRMTFLTFPRRHFVRVRIKYAQRRLALRLADIAHGADRCRHIPQLRR